MSIEQVLKDQATKLEKYHRALLLMNSECDLKLIGGELHVVDLDIVIPLNLGSIRTELQNLAFDWVQDECSGIGNAVYSEIYSSVQREVDTGIKHSSGVEFDESKVIDPWAEPEAIITAGLDVHSGHYVVTCNGEVIGESKVVPLQLIASTDLETTEWKPSPDAERNAQIINEKVTFAEPAPSIYASEAMLKQYNERHHADKAALIPDSAEARHKELKDKQAALDEEEYIVENRKRAKRSTSLDNNHPVTEDSNTDNPF